MVEVSDADDGKSPRANGCIMLGSGLAVGSCLMMSTGRDISSLVLRALSSSSLLIPWDAVANSMGAKIWFTHSVSSILFSEGYEGALSAHILPKGADDVGVVSPGGMEEVGATSGGVYWAGMTGCFESGHKGGHHRSNMCLGLGESIETMTTTCRVQCS